MAIKRYKPITSGLRHATRPDFSEITKSKPEKSLLRPLKRTGGRNARGRITSRFRGGGHKRMYRLVDFDMSRFDQPARVLAIEYDPNRTSRIALIQYPDQKKSYVLAPLELKVGDTIVSTVDGEVEIKTGNRLPLSRIPLGTAIHNIELQAGKGGQMVRSAGSSAQITAKEGDFALIRLPSREIRRFHLKCRATIGQLSNVSHEIRSYGKAGRMRWRGRRGHVRGVVMNPVDHPHGGGEGKTPQGNPHPVSPWGQSAKGLKTRTKRKYSNKFIVKRRAK